MLSSTAAPNGDQQAVPHHRQAFDVEDGRLDERTGDTATRTLLANRELTFRQHASRYLNTWDRWDCCLLSCCCPTLTCLAVIVVAEIVCYVSVKEGGFDCLGVS